MEFLKAVLFGIVEGITEWLPISSTGHMILLDEFVKLNVSDEFWNLFLVVIQLGAILAVIVLYWKKLWPIGKDKEGFYFDYNILQMWLKIIVASVPAAVIGLLFDDVFEKLFYKPVCVALALIIFGIAFIVVERFNQGRTASIRKISDISYPVALGFGCFQLLAAIFPGTSRSGATIIGGLIMGCSRKLSAQFTFFMAIPVMLGASLLKVLKFSGTVTGTEIGILIVGMAVAFAVSFFVIRFLMDYIRKHDFTVFGIYRIVLGVLVMLYFLVFAK